MSDSQIPDEIALRISKLINAVEDVREQANDDLKTIWRDCKDELKALGWHGANISAEVAFLKAAIVEERRSEEDLAKIEKKADGVFRYIDLLKSPRARAREEFGPGTGNLSSDLVSYKTGDSAVPAPVTACGSGQADFQPASSAVGEKSAAFNHYSPAPSPRPQADARDATSQAVTGHYSEASQ